MHDEMKQYEPEFPKRRLRVLFLVGSLEVSGGTNLIFQNAQSMVRSGHSVCIAALKSGTAPNWNRASVGLSFIEIDQAESDKFDVAIATWWPTVYFLPRIKADRYVYFVQSIESRFMVEDPLGRVHQELAAKTYTLELAVITVARWIQLFLAHRYQRPSFLVRNGIDKRKFCLHGPALLERNQGHLKKPRLLIEGPQNVSFKGVAESISAAIDAGYEEIWHVGYSGSPHPRVHHLSRVAYDEMPSLYRSCDILLKLSWIEGMYGPPLEMFHCGGTAVTYNVTGFSEYIEHDVNSKVVSMGDYNGVVDTLKMLKENPIEVMRLKAGAVQTASQWPDITTTGSDFARAVESLSQFDTDNTEALKHKIRGIHDGENLI